MAQGFSFDAATCVLLIISTEHHNVMSAFTGGPQAEAEWSQRVPNASVVHIKSDHLTVPYTSETGWCIIHFLGSVSGSTFRPDDVRADRAHCWEARHTAESVRRDALRLPRPCEEMP